MRGLFYTNAIYYDNKIWSLTSKGLLTNINLDDYKCKYVFPSSREGIVPERASEIFNGLCCEKGKLYWLSRNHEWINVYAIEDNEFEKYYIGHLIGSDDFNAIFALGWNDTILFFPEKIGSVLLFYPNEHKVEKQNVTASLESINGILRFPNVMGDRVYFADTINGYILEYSLENNRFDIVCSDSFSSITYFALEGNYFYVLENGKTLYRCKELSDSKDVYFCDKKDGTFCAFCVMGDSITLLPNRGERILDIYDKKRIHEDIDLSIPADAVCLPGYTPFWNIMKLKDYALAGGRIGNYFLIIKENDISWKKLILPNSLEDLMEIQVFGGVEDSVVIEEENYYLEHMILGVTGAYTV